MDSRQAWDKPELLPSTQPDKIRPDFLGWKETWWRTTGHRGRFIVKVMMLKLGKGPFQGPGRGPSKVFTGTQHFLNFHRQTFLYVFLERPLQNKMYNSDTGRLRFRDVK